MQNNNAIFYNSFKLNRFLVLIMAAATGITVANLYYIQPLLAEIATEFNVTQVSVGFVAMLTQAGYALGMLFLLPLADIKEKRKLIITMLCCSCGSLLLMFFSKSIVMIAFSSFAIGFTSVVPQLIVPLAAQLADPKERGRIIGTVMSGLLIGILLSRTFSGLIGEYLGWRVVYLIAAVLMLVLAVFLRRFIPECPGISSLGYKDLFKSMGRLAKQLPVLREASLNGAMMFGAFSAFWTTLVFLLQSPAYKMGADVAGLFGLIGIIGALTAPIVGRIADKRSPRFTVGIGMFIVTAAYLCFLFLGFKLWGLITGIILLDLGVQSCQISNQARVHALSDEARNRINTVFMVSYFVGGATGSFLGSFSLAHFSWTGVCIFGLLTQVIAVTGYMIRSNKNNEKPDSNKLADSN
ncbi:MFS transporter [Ruminiclostridium papyrosolvens]|uniref:MFS transporter n=1 Tax=Ruminiclostridium papyrosolvens C7 TaxID=1330534 RepID=U4R225_9FIRM|nr:MFS transporter [Ruminiclostridium papyrosolvens]EPR12127.1 MFS transporter [Ruminiclostridium papyrosolvens C7]